MSKEADVNCDGESSSADECDNNKSFVKKVTTHVSEFIPQTLSKWFGNKLRQRDEFDEEDETYQLPPSKRIKKSSNNYFDMNIVGTPLHGKQHNPFSADTFKEPVPGPSNINARKLVLAASNHFIQNQGDQTNGGDSDSGESTSGYSSMPRIGSKELVSDLPTQTNLQPSHNSTTVAQNKSIFNLSIPSERTLFGESSTSPQKTNTSLSLRRPSFNASAFGAPNFMDKTLSTRRIFNSPFYSGRITYGGASAYNRSIVTNSPERGDRGPSIQPRLVNENKSAALSKTAKRILDTLEQYTSPVQDVRRIPTGRRGQRPEGLIGKYVGANPYSVRDIPKTPCNKELQVPTMSDLLKMKLKERLQDSTSSVRDLAKTSNSSINNDTYSIKTHDDDKQTGKNRNKIKTKVSFVRQKPSGIIFEPGPETVNLPDVQLPISTLPSFNFSIPLNNPTTSKSEQTSDTKKKSLSTNKTVTPVVTDTPVSVTTSAPPINFVYSENKTNTPIIPVNKAPIAAPIPIPDKIDKATSILKNNSNMEFRFSKPLVIAENKFKALTAINNFKFSMPVVKKVCNDVSNIKNSTEITKVTEKSLPKTGFGDMFKMASDKWECDVCMVRNQASATTCISCTSSKPSAKSVVNGSEKPALITPASSWGDKFKPPSNSWECSMCMVQNDSGKAKCIACENPRSANTTAVTNNKGTSLDNFKKKENEWECSSCMVRNPDNKQKCVCCEAPKPGAKTLLPTLTTSSSSSWGDKFKAPPSTWECTMCLVRNDVAKEKCVACENPRPAGIAPPKGIAGFKKKDEWECSSCMVKNPNNQLKCVCCEAPKPSSKSVPTAQVSDVPKFSFGIENGLINGHGFMFGIPADKNTKQDTSVLDSGSSSNTEIKKPESNGTSAQFSFGIKPLNGAKSIPDSITPASSEPPKVETTNATFSFGVPATKKRTLDNDVLVSETSKKSESPLSVSSNSNTINGLMVKPQTTEPPKFTFGVNAAASANKSPTFSFSAPKSTENSSDIPTKSSENEPKSFSFETTKTVPAASNTNNSKSMFGIASATTSTTGVLNATTPSLAESKDSSAPPLFKFGSASLPSKSMFNSGSNNASTNGPVPTFNFAAPKAVEKPAEPTAPATFTFNAPTTKATFNSSNAFNTSSTPTIFGSGNTNNSTSTTTTNNSNNMFGNIAAQSTIPTPTFGASNNNGDSLFGQAKLQPPSFANVVSAPSFGNSAGTTSGNTFGKSVAANGVFNFGGSSQSTEPAKPAFNFGSASSSTSGSSSFNFGASANPPSVNGGFNFSSGSNTAVPTFDANAKPTFNFTGGAPTSFTSQDSTTKPPPGRVIRRAIRRTQR